jgi:hypothetical protein
LPYTLGNLIFFERPLWNRSKADQGRHRPIANVSLRPRS